MKLILHQIRDARCEMRDVRYIQQIRASRYERQIPARRSAGGRDTRYEQGLYSKLKSLISYLLSYSYLLSPICLFLSLICLFCVLQGCASSPTQNVRRMTRDLSTENEIVFYDERYLPTDYVENPEQIVSFLEGRVFYHLEADELKDWMDVKISGNASGTVCVMTMGFVPDTVAETMDKNCTIYKYLEAGGKIVWIGNVPFWYRGHIAKNPDKWGAKGLEAILEIEAIEEDHFGDYVEITEEGGKRGMEVVDNAKFPVAMEDVTIVLSKTTGSKGLASSWFKNINSGYPESGFIRYRATWYDGARNDLNEDLYYLSVYPDLIRTSIGIME